MGGVKCIKCLRYLGLSGAFFVVRLGAKRRPDVPALSGQSSGEPAGADPSSSYGIASPHLMCGPSHCLASVGLCPIWVQLGIQKMYLLCNVSRSAGNVSGCCYGNFPGALCSFGGRLRFNPLSTNPDTGTLSIAEDWSWFSKHAVEPEIFICWKFLRAKGLI